MRFLWYIQKWVNAINNRTLIEISRLWYGKFVWWPVYFMFNMNYQNDVINQYSSICLSLVSSRVFALCIAHVLAIRIYTHELRAIHFLGFHANFLNPCFLSTLVINGYKIVPCNQIIYFIVPNTKRDETIFKAQLQQCTCSLSQQFSKLEFSWKSAFHSPLLWCNLKTMRPKINRF